MVELKKIYTKSNLISFIRLILVIPLWILLDNFQSQGTRYYIIGLILIGAATDILDGFLARKFNEVSELGKIIDPLADKIALAVLVIKLYLIAQISAGYFFLIIGRDVLIFLGGVIVTKKLGKVLPSNALGKITVINISLVMLLIIMKVSSSNIIFEVLYYLSIFLIVASLIAYTIRATEFIRQKNHGSV
jgi:cardiolipin synthase (CMP-forming)